MLLMILPALGLAVYNGFEQRQTGREQARERAILLAKLAASDQDHLIDSTRELLAPLANNLLTTEAPATFWNPCFRNLLLLQPQYMNFGIVGVNGSLVASALPFSGSVNYLDRSFFRNVLKTRQFSVGELEADPLTNRSTITIGCPVFGKDGKLTRVLFATVDKKLIGEIAGKAALPAKSVLVIFDQPGHVVSRTPDSGAGQAGPPSRLFQTISSQNQGSVELTDPDGNRRLYAFASVHEGVETSLSAAVGFPIKLIYADADRILIRNLTLLALVALGALGAAQFYASRYVLRPLAALTSAAKRLASGDLDARARLKRGVELYQLAHSFDDMADKLQTLVSSLERKNVEITAAEAKFRRLVEQSLVGIYMIQDSRFVYVNPKMSEIFGFPAEELTARPLVDFIDEEDRALVTENLRKRIAGEVESIAYQLCALRQDGRKIHLEAHGGRTEYNGRPAVLGMLLDITERKQIQRTMLRTQRLEAIGTLASGVAHDLNNALAPIMMGVELLRMQYPQESSVLEMFGTSAKRGADMVRQLLTFAKGAEGNRVLVRPNHLVGEMVNLIKSSFPKNIQLTVKCDQKLPAVLGDPTQLHQVLLNLCVNARDAMPSGGALTLEVFCANVDAMFAGSAHDAKPGKYLAFQVTDTGMGIPAEILDRIFDPFFTTKGPEKGTGLGLSTVTGIVKGHGGFLKVYSQPKKGSTFTAYLPADSADSETDQSTRPEIEFRGQGETILLVDDEAAIRATGRAVLQRLNFKSLTATDGADAMIQAAEHCNELRVIISDLHMPNMDGLTFVRMVRQILPNIPIVMTSGQLDDADAKEFEKLGVTNQLGKPFTEHQLADVLKTIL
jgi:PAS domain S-box-containing protein